MLLLLLLSLIGRRQTKNKQGTVPIIKKHNQGLWKQVSNLRDIVPYT